MYLATQLLSRTISKAFKLLFPEGTTISTDDGNVLDSFSELSDFIEMADDWFDCFNSRAQFPHKKSWKLAKHGYGVNYDIQKLVLDKFCDAVKNTIIETHVDMIGRHSITTWTR